MKKLGFINSLYIASFLITFLPNFLNNAFSQEKEVNTKLEHIRPNWAWDSYVQSLEPILTKLQENCKPRRLTANPAVKFKGSALFFHGFTACNQQFFEISEQLTAQGFDVYLPLTPGHGMQFTENNQDDTSLMPTPESWETYEAFSKNMKEIALIAKRHSSNVVTAGVSVGGTIALRVVTLAPYLFESAILYAPQFELEDFRARTIAIPLAMTLPSIGEVDYSWGPACFIEERQNGRAGICNFKAKHMAAAQIFANETIRRLKKLPHSSTTQIQLLGVQKDIVVSNQKIFEVYKKLLPNPSAKNKVSTCLYPLGTNHSMLSRYDSYTENKFWIDGLISQSILFIKNKKPFSIEQTANKNTCTLNFEEKHFDICSIGPN